MPLVFSLVPRSQEEYGWQKYTLVRGRRLLTQERSSSSAAANSVPLSKVMLLKIALNRRAPSFRSSASSALTTVSALRFGIAIMISFRVLRSVRVSRARVVFRFPLPLYTVSPSQWPNSSRSSISSGRCSMLSPAGARLALLPHLQCINSGRSFSSGVSCPHSPHLYPYVSCLAQNALIAPHSSHCTIKKPLYGPWSASGSALFQVSRAPNIRSTRLPRLSSRCGTARRSVLAGPLSPFSGTTCPVAVSSKNTLPPCTYARNAPRWHILRTSEILVLSIVLTSCVYVRWNRLVWLV